MSETVTETLRLVITAKSDQAKTELKQTTSAIKDFGDKAEKDFADVQKKVALLEKQLEDMQRGAKQNLGAAGTAAQQFGQQAQQGMGQAGASADDTGKHFEKLTDVLQAQFKELRGDMQGLTGAVGQGFGKMSQDSATLQHQMGKSFDGMEGAVKDFHKTYSDNLGKVTEETKKPKKAFEDLEAAAKDLATQSGIAFAAVAASIGLATHAAGDLQAQLNTLQAVSGASVAEMNALHEKSMALGQSSGFTSTQVAGASVELAKLGFTSKEVIDSLDGIVSAAAASGTGLADAGELVAGTIRGFGLSAKDAAMVADVLAQAANKSALDFSDMATSMKYVAPIAQASGQKLTDMIGIMGVLSNSMIKGETAGTALRGMMVAMQAPSGDAAKYIKKLGLEVADAQGKILPLPEIIGQLQDKLAKFNQKSQNKILAEIFGAEALPAASVLMKTSKADLDSMIESMEHATGASKEMASVMQQGINAELAKLSSKANTLAQDLGERMSPQLEEAVKFLQKFLDIVIKLPDPVKNTATQVFFLAGAITALGLGLGGAVAGGSKFLGMLGKISTFIATKMPWLAEIGTGGMIGGPVGIVATIAAIGSHEINKLADKENDKAVETDLQSSVGDPNAAISRLNAFSSRKYQKEIQDIDQAQKDATESLKGLDLDKALEKIKKRREDAKKFLGDFTDLSQSELKQAVLDAQTAKNMYGQQVQAANGSIQEIKQKIQEAEKSINAPGITNATKLVLQPRLDALKQQLRNQEAASKAEIQSATTQVNHFQSLKIKFEGLLSNRVKDIAKPGTETVADDGADKENQKRVQDLADAQSRQTATFQTELARRVAAVKDNNKQIGDLDDALSDKLAQNAQNKVSQYSDCFHQVYKAYRETFGDGGVFDKMTGAKGDDPNFAADAAQALAKDTKRFHEVGINAQNYKQVLANLKGTAIIIYERGAGGLSSEAGHAEVYNHKTGLAYYGHGGVTNMTAERANHARLFEMNVGSSTKEAQKLMIQQQGMVQLAAIYNQQLQDAIALRDQLPAQSDAWKKADEQVFKLQQEMQKAQIDGGKLTDELMKKQREDAIRWANEKLDIETALAEAEAKLTDDTRDDIEASYKRSLAEIAKAENTRLSQENTSEEQRTQLKKVYDAQRLAAEKAYHDQVREYNKNQAAYILNLEQGLEDSRIKLMADGLEKSLAMIDLEKKRKRDAFDEEYFQRKKLWESAGGENFIRQDTGDHGGLPGSKRTVRFEDTQEGKDLAAKGQANDDEAAFLSKQLKRLDANRRKMDEFAARNADIDLNLKGSLQGQHDPIKIEELQTEALQERFKVQKEITADLERQKSEVLGTSTEGLDFAKKIADSKRQEIEYEIQLRDIMFQGLEREKQDRQQITAELTRAVTMGTDGFAHILGLNQGIGAEVGQWVDAIQKGVALMKDSNGDPMDLISFFKPNGSGGSQGMDGLSNLMASIAPGAANATASGGGIAAAGGVLAGATGGGLAAAGGGAAAGGALAGAAGGLAAAGPIGLAIGAGLVGLDLLGKGAAEFWRVFAGDPAVIQRQAQEHKNNILRMDSDLLDARIQLAKRKGDDTTAMEKQQLAIRKELELRALDQQGEELKKKKTGWGGLSYTREEVNAIDYFNQELGQRRLAIEAKYNEQSEAQNEEHLKRIFDANKNAHDAYESAVLSASQQNAALTAGKEDDLAIEVARRKQDAWKTYADRMAIIQKKFDEAKANGGTPVWDAAAEDAANKEKEATYKTIHNYEKMQQLEEEQRINGVLSATEEQRIKLSTKGLQQEIELLRLKNAMEKNSLENKLKNPSLDPREREALNAQLKNLQSQLTKDEYNTTHKWKGIDANALIDLNIEKAKQTDKSQLDDAVAEYEKTLQSLVDAEMQARESMTGTQLNATLDKISLARINSEQATQKKLKQIWLSEYTDRLNQQKTLIQEATEAERQSLEQSMRNAQDLMRPLQLEAQKLQRDLEDSQRKRDAEKKPFDPKDNVQSAQFKADYAALDATGIAWQGVQDISNTTNKPALNNVSYETARLGLIKEADLMELSASNDFRRELITEVDYVQQMQKAQLVRAKAADEALKTEKLSKEKKLGYEKEWADAYQKYQELALEAIDARYDQDDKRTQENLTLKEQSIQVQQDAIDGWQRQMDKMNREAEEKIRPIDAEILRATQSTREWAPAWDGVTSGIAAARKEAEALLATQQQLANTKAALQSSASYSGGGGAGQQTDYSPYTQNAPSDIQAAQDAAASVISSIGLGSFGGWGMASGGGIRNPKAKGDKFLTFLDDQETVVPLDKWGLVLAPFLKQVAGPMIQPAAGGGTSITFSPKIDIRGNQIIGEFDMYQTARQAMSDFWQDSALKHGSLYGI